MTEQLSRENMSFESHFLQIRFLDKNWTFNMVKSISFSSFFVPLDDGLYSLFYENGGLAKVQTPRGHFHTFSQKASVGLMRFQYQGPWIQDATLAFELMFNGQGQILRQRLPSKGSQHVTYTYDDNGLLKKIMVGETESELGHDHDTGLLESVVTRCGHHFDMRTRMKYHGGLMKEMKVRFSGSSSPDFDNAIFRYQYDGNGRLAVMLSAIGSGNDHQATDTFSYNAHTGTLESKSGFRFSKLSYNKTFITDAEDNFYKSYEFDGLGRIAKVAIGVQRSEMISYELKYNAQGKIRSRNIRNHEGRPSEENLLYTKSGKISKIWGPDNFDFAYDENGNLVKIQGPQGAINANFDMGDRVDQVSVNAEPTKITYDEATGCVNSVKSNANTRHFWHDARGKLVQLMSIGQLNKGQTRTSFQYDNEGRLVALLKSSGRNREVTQFFYADFRHPQRVSHVRYPSSGLTQRLHYDQKGHLMALETKDQKLYVATDHRGSPLLVFRADGTLDKAVKYSAFGQILADSNPNMAFPMTFKGGIDLGNGLYLINQRIYDPLLRQWLNPDWQSLVKPLDNPEALHVYRFDLNDPINDLNEAMTYKKASDLNFWAGLYGYDMDLMMGDKSSEETTIVHPDLILASGLDEAVTKARNGLRTLSFVPLPKTKERLILNPTVASKHSGFGQGFLLTSMASNDLTYANVVDGAPGVVQTIFLSVLNGSKYLDEVSYLDSAQRSVYFFAKRTGTSSDIAEALMASDVDNVNRLAGQFSVDIKSLQRGKDLIISNQEMELHVLYR